MSGRGAGLTAEAGAATLAGAGAVGAGATPTRALAAHWPEYLMEAAGLGLFMVAACLFALLLEHPTSPVHRTLPDPLGRRALMGLAMGSTAVALIYSPMGRRSGAHLNPAVTLTFLRLGKIDPWDALFYAAAQFTGGLAGVLLAAAAIGPALSHSAVRYVATVPGHRGPAVAFVAEAAISFGLMLAVLTVSNSMRHARHTGLVAGALVATWITVEAPLSGMSMNPARSFGSAVPAALLSPLWIYFAAPPLGMLLAAELYRRLAPGRKVICAKLDHGGRGRCIFRCEYARAS
jgi:aquaporin Z